MLALRSLVQPLAERGALRDPARLEHALELADAGAADQDPVLGVSARAIR
jgi:hypothetical protein